MIGAVAAGRDQVSTEQCGGVGRVFPGSRRAERARERESRMGMGQVQEEGVGWADSSFAESYPPSCATELLECVSEIAGKT